MNISRIDLNLLVYFDVLLQEQNVTRAAHQLGITQPAMSNGLRRLRDLFGDPLLVRTSEGMTATERALELQPQIRAVLAGIEKAVQPSAAFDPITSSRVFRVMVSDYGESTLLPAVLGRMLEESPNSTLDILTPSDVSFNDLEQGKVDMAINRFDELPQSFHQMPLWKDKFACLMSANNPVLADFTLENYLKARHIWVSKTGIGAGVGMSPEDKQRLGWVDEALASAGQKRNISVFTRQYQVAQLLANHNNLIATLPSKSAMLEQNNPALAIRKPPFEIPPFDLRMAWSPLLQQNASHQWFRRMIVEVAKQIDLQGSNIQF